MRRDRRYKHGMSNTTTYHAWEGMFFRTKNSKYYQDISICERWKKFENFYEDMGKCPRGMTLERIDNSKDYSPANCKWATRQEQNWNKRCTLKIHHDGRDWTVKDIAEKFGLNPHTVRERMQKKLNWNYITMPLSQGKRFDTMREVV